MENDAHVVGLDAPIANSKTVKPDLRPRTGIGQILLLRVIQDYQARAGLFWSASPCCLDGGNVDLLHGHHRLESTLGLTATSRERIG